MNWSLGALTAEVPLGVVTVTFDGAGPRRRDDRETGGGDPVIPVPGVEPKSTAVAPVKLVPVTVTEVPPAVGPVGRADSGDGRQRRGVVGELVTRRVDRRGAVGGGHRDVDGAGPRRRVTVSRWR